VSYFVDTSVLLLAVGTEGPARVACRNFLAMAANRGAAVHISVEAAQEYVFHRSRRMGRATALAEGARLPDMYVVHDFGLEVYERSLSLMGTSALRGRDAVHAATALLAGFTQIVSADHDFESVPGLHRIDPATFTSS
jgi:predicted nucleic acid-binding protein